MTAGLPGTGLGGLFYMILVMLMPLREGYMTLRGKSSFGRWRLIALHWALGAGIIGALFGVSWLIGRAIMLAVQMQWIGPSIQRSVVNHSAVSSKLAFLISLIVLCSLVLLTYVLRLALTIAPRRRSR